ncbi:hypothetical protein [Paenibacillus macerans]|uniref:hypothetical protein n=1 Tax=Paenibacillus macerans TaxID=44252 RepID=UPI00203E87CC|nr:hypothetical protein [Paenibacillus macerans]MCM3698605.1 hypothetical protein [Paenibacillus macerans]
MEFIAGLYANDNIDTNYLDLDTIIKMLKMSYSLELWDKLIQLSDDLLKRAKNITLESYKPTKSYIYYYGYSLLIKGSALKELRRYDESKQCIQQYSDLSWLNPQDHEGKNEVEFFKYIALPNRYEVELLSGNINILNSYVEFLKENQGEIIPGLTSILRAANMHKFKVDKEISLFTKQIEQLNKPINHEIIDITCLYKWLYNELIVYFVNQSEYKRAIDNCLNMLQLSFETDNSRFFKKAVFYYETLRDFATATQNNQYIKMIKRGLKEEEISYLHNVADFVG